MDLIENNTYRYIAVGFGGLFLVPQIIHGYRRQSLEDLSTITLFFIVCMSSLWTYYMYEMNYVLYVYISGFICLNAVILILMQLTFYYKRFKKHVKTFETKPKPEPKPKQEPVPEIPEAVPAPMPIILQMPPQQQIPVVPLIDIESQSPVPEPFNEKLKIEPTVI